MKRVRIILLAILFVPLMAPVEAATTSCPAPQAVLIARQAAQLEAKYGISVEYIIDGNILVEETGLTTLDLALETATPELVRFVSAHYQDATGHPLTVRYVRADRRDGTAGDGAALAAFQRDTATMELYVLSPDNPAIVTGENPISIVHEFGHALHLLYAERYGEQRMREEWVAWNGGEEYDASHLSSNPNDRVFVSGYAATMYEEDVAETIGHVFVRHKPGQGFLGRLSESGNLTGLGGKVAYIEGILSEIDEAAGALQNYCRMYSAEPTIRYREVAFSGDYLQFAGYPAPRHVLPAVLDDLGQTAQTAVWMEDIGGWHILRPNGTEMIVFPGGVWCDIDGMPAQYLSAR